MDLTNKHWQRVQPLISQPSAQSPRRGRPWRDSRHVLDGILWILATRAPWKDLPSRYPPYQTCHRRFHQWLADGTLIRILGALPEDFKQTRGLDRIDPAILATRQPR